MRNSDSKKILRIQFESPERLRAEFERNISNGGIFVPSESDFAIRQRVVVEIGLDYDDAARISLDGEVVHRIPPEMAPSGVVPGVAIQFEISAKNLRERFEPLLGALIHVVPPDVEVVDNVDRRGPPVGRAKRRAVRVPTRVMPESSPPFEATSRDLSATGILLSLGEVVLSKGEVVRICLWHPSGDMSVEIDGKVVREVRNKSGRIAAVAVAFDRHQSADARVVEVIEALSQASQRSKLGGISGAIADLGLANLLQMFGTSAPRGTVVCERGGEQGWIAFADGDLLRAELGELRGQQALIAMLDWDDGRFEFEASADEKLVKTAERHSLTASILEAVCAMDERDEAEAHARTTGMREGATIESEATQQILGSETTFSVNLVLEESTRMVLGKAEQAVLDLAKSGFMVQKIVEIIPEEERLVYRALKELIESGVLRVR